MDLQLILIAAGGALAIQLLSLAELPKVPKEERPDFRDPVYYLPYLINPVLGGFLAWVYLLSNQPLSALVALNVGASAPLLLRTLAGSLPKF